MDPSFQALAEKYSTYGYPVLFLGVLLESAGIPVPAETAVLVAGFLASPAGGSHFSLPLVIVITALAAMLGDNAGYELGRRLARPRLAAGRRFLFLTPALLHRAEGYFERYGTWTIFLGRFVAALRVAAALAAGTAGMPWPRFFLANAAGAVLWATAITLLGYFFGQSWQLLHYYLGRGGLILACIVALLFGLPYLVRRARKVRSLNVPERAVVIQAVVVVLLELVCVALLVLLAHGHHEAPLDREVQHWVEAHPAPWTDAAARVGVALGTLPAVCLLVACGAAWLAYRKRPGRESALLAGMAVASEAVGWVLIGLLRGHPQALVAADIWPYGFAGLGPLRAVAVFGAGTYLLKHQAERRAVVWPFGVLLILWVCLGVVWTREQTLTQVLLETASGALLVFVGVLWLERGRNGGGEGTPTAGTKETRSAP